MDQKNRNIFYVWGAFFGFSLGMIFSKAYLAWAYSFYTSGMYEWPDPPDPLWLVATAQPFIFTYVVVLLFIIAGLLFVRTLIKNKAL